LARKRLSERRWGTYLLLIKHSKEGKIWEVASKYATISRKRLPAVNLSKISRTCSPKDQILVPGKVLGTGKLEHPAQIAAFSFSMSALKAIEIAGGKAMSVKQLIELNPKGKGVKIIV